MQGRSQAAFVLCDDGNHYVVKSVGCPQGPNVLANEWLGSILAASVHLPTSRSRFVNFSPSFIASNPELTYGLFPGAIQTMPGLHAGSLFAGEVTGAHRVLQYLPKKRSADVANRHCFLGMYIFDIWAGQRAPRKVLFRRTGATSPLEPTFINHSQLFGGPSWEFVEPEQPLCHGNLSVYLGQWSSPVANQWVESLRRRVPQVLASAMAFVPEGWYVSDLSGLRAFLLERLEYLPELFDRRAILEGVHTTRT